MLGEDPTVRGLKHLSARESSPPTGRKHVPGDAAAGHRTAEHTADVIVEAWGPDRAACLAQAVHGLVASFCDTGAAGATAEHTFTLHGRDDEDLLVELLGEVLYLLDARDRIPVVATVEESGESLEVRFGLAPVGEVEVVGAVPKAITYHGLSVTGGEDGWRCRVTIDV